MNQETILIRGVDEVYLRLSIPDVNIKGGKIQIFQSIFLSKFF